MQRTKSKILSILLSLVMLLSLLPTTALAVTYPNSVTVYNRNKQIIGLSDGQCLAANDAASATSYTSGSPYVARYDKSSGTLYLKDYHGVAAERGIEALGDLKIVVEENSSFTTSIISNENLMGIQASGKLNIFGTGKLTVTANGKGDVYGIYADKGVTISAPLDVQTSATDNSTAYGIYTRSGAISLSDGDKAVTATGGTSAVYGVYNATNTSTAITNNGNIDISGKLTVNLNNGDSNDGIRTGSGGTITLNGATVNIPSNFASGIYNNNGNVVIENGSNVTLSSGTSTGIGIYARYGGNLTIENSTVTVSAKRLTASVGKGTLTIKDSIVDLTLDEAFNLVVETASNAANEIDLSGSSSGSVTLTASGNQTGAMIGGKVTATPGTKLEKGTHYPGLETYDGLYDDVLNKTVLKFVHESAPAALGGSASISGTAKYGEVLTAETASITGNTGTFSYQWKRNGADITSATNSTYKLVEDDIGKTITVAITSSAESGTIVSSATATVEKADGPAAPTAFTLSFTLNSDGTTFTVTIPAFAGGEYSFDGATYSPTTSTKSDCNPNTSYTGYARIAETPTRKASAPTSSMQTSPKLTVATPTFTPNGASSFTGTQSVTISCTTVGATIHYTTDGTEPTASSPVYSTALSLTSTTTVKAIAVNTGMNDSAIATATFTKYSGGGGGSSSSGGGGSSYSPSYSITPGKSENGSITVSPKSARKGDTVTITVTPDKGYELEDLTVLDSKGKELALTEKNGKYSFKMPAGKVEVKATFIKEAEISPFDDVSTNAYYYEAVKWAQEKGITGGIGNKLFGPNDPCTRAQIVTFLWRAAGSPAPKNIGTAFGDVKPGSFYEQAVAWAVENGITGGTGDGMFSPDATCTRAQSVTFLYRAAGSPAVSGSAEFGDVATNAYYADAVAWAAKNGVTDGIGGGQFGSGNDCTRGQIVTFLYRAYNK